MEQWKMPTKEEMKQMADVDIREVDAKDLVDIDDVHINTDLPREERIADYIRQIKNPYCYISHGIIVKIGFSGERTFEECIRTCISMEG